VERGAQYGAILSICAVAAVLRFWRLGEAALIGDESYYWLWSERLAPAYFDNAAGVALVVRASTALGGQSEVGIRWLNALLGVGAVSLLYVLGAQLYSPRAGTIAAAFLAVGAPFLVVSRFVYTDALQIALLLLNLVLLAPLVVDRGGMTPSLREGVTQPPLWPRGMPADEGSVPVRRAALPVETWRLWAIGLSMAALFNSKYNAYLYALAVLAVLLVRRRALFADRRAWTAIALALCGLLPVLIWNARHDWVSFRWQFQHFGVGTVFRSSVQANVRHALVYLTPPLALTGVLGAFQVRRLRRQILLVPALVLVLPILLGPTDSPRNLLTGWVLLSLLAGDLFDRWIARSSALAWVALGALWVWASAYGLGTVMETMAPTVLPSSSVARPIRVDGAGWRRVGRELEPGGQVFALDYSIASQLRYYSGRPVQTAWGQYRLWGIPAICGPGARQERVQIVALGYLDPALVSLRLRQTFGQVWCPVELRMGESKVLYTWTVRDCTVDQDTFLDRFDFMRLLEVGEER
jgi:4-amino-4-deoxy-L-arabinose transferase-like glycosyltransferase